MKVNKELCWKLIFKNSEFDKSPCILFGIKESEDSIFLNFRTAKKLYCINKNIIISLEQTNMPFVSAEVNL